MQIFKIFLMRWQQFSKLSKNCLTILLEFKYVSLKDLKLTGEQVRAKSLEELAALPAVTAELDAAAAQARRYGAALTGQYGLTDLRLFAVVGVGLERVAYQAVGASIAANSGSKTAVASAVNSRSSGSASPNAS